MPVSCTYAEPQKLCQTLPPSPPQHRGGGGGVHMPCMSVVVYMTIDPRIPTLPGRTYGRGNMRS